MLFLHEQSINLLLTEMREPSEQLNAYMEGLGEGQLMPFHNPVCKETYESLPKIYGFKKKPKRASKPEHRLKNLELLELANQQKSSATKRSLSRYLFAGKVQYGSLINKTRRYLTEHYTPVHNNERKQEVQPYHSAKKKTYLGPILPPAKSFELDDLQSRHKVSQSISRLENNQNRSKTQLEKFIHLNRKPKFNNMPDNNSSIPEIVKPKAGNSIQKILSPVVSSSKNTGGTKIIRATTEKDVQKDERNIFSPDSSIKEENDDDLNETKNKLIKRNRSSKKKRNNLSEEKRNRYETANEQKQKNKLTLSAEFLNGLKNDNTMFKSLKKSVSNKSSRKGSVMSNGFFRVPESKDYKEFIENYQPQKPSFSLKEMLRSPDFRILREDKQVYFGEVDGQNSRQGKGVLISEKQIYEGIFEKDQKVKGYQRNMDGVYVGSFRNGLRHGEGEFKWNNGQQFVGQWQNGMKNGFGKWRAPQGHSYEGQWRNNKQNGQGIYRHKVSTYRGEFKDFLKQGYGQEIFINGDKYKGSYKNGKPQGEGIYLWHSGGSYEGNFVSGIREGYGVLKDEHGNCYEGNFKQDNKEGEGKEKYSNGDIFEGIFKMGARKSGILKKNDGEEIEIKDS